MAGFIVMVYVTGVVLHLIVVCQWNVRARLV